MKRGLKTKGFASIQSMVRNGKPAGVLADCPHLWRAVKSRLRKIALEVDGICHVGREDYDSIRDHSIERLLDVRARFILFSPESSQWRIPRTNLRLLLEWFQQGSLRHLCP